jgi:hypothetical protein
VNCADDLLQVEVPLDTVPVPDVGDAVDLTLNAGTGVPLG